MQPKLPNIYHDRMNSINEIQLPQLQSTDMLVKEVKRGVSQSSSRNIGGTDKQQ